MPGFTGDNCKTLIGKEMLKEMEIDVRFMNHKTQYC